MITNQRMPLVSICLTCYNQAKYIRKTLDSLVSQDYKNLEVVIYDDSSTDDTDAIIRQWIGETECIRPELKIVHNRNATNLGIAKNYDLCFRRASGELLITAAGDDYYAPNKVTRFVEEWLKTNKRASIIHSGYTEVSVDDDILVYKEPRSALGVLGGTAGYSRTVFDMFEPPTEALDVEDQVYSKRAMMLGEEIRMPDALTYYRMGSGYSTNSTDIRARDLKFADSMLMSVAQLKRDVVWGREHFDACRVDKVDAIVRVLEKEALALKSLVQGRWAFKRLCAFMWTCGHRGLEYSLSRDAARDFHYVLPSTAGKAWLVMIGTYLNWYQRSKVFSLLRSCYRKMLHHGEFKRG